MAYTTTITNCVDTSSTNTVRLDLTCGVLVDAFGFLYDRADDFVESLRDFKSALQKIKPLPFYTEFIKERRGGQRFFGGRADAPDVSGGNRSIAHAQARRDAKHALRTQWLAGLHA